MQRDHGDPHDTLEGLFKHPKTDWTAWHLKGHDPNYKVGFRSGNPGEVSWNQPLSLLLRAGPAGQKPFSDSTPGAIEFMNLPGCKPGLLGKPLHYRIHEGPGLGLGALD